MVARLSSSISWKFRTFCQKWTDDFFVEFISVDCGNCSFRNRTMLEWIRGKLNLHALKSTAIEAAFTCGITIHVGSAISCTICHVSWNSGFTESRTSSTFWSWATESKTVVSDLKLFIFAISLYSFP